MLLKKITLENIRSHVLTELEFPLGKMLLAGNIGCGKSSILLGIDFALFGLTRGMLSGDALLRNGKHSGRVRLEFEIDGNIVVLERVLKRNAAGVSQDAGSISVNGVRVEKSAVELKQAVLDLLHYPGELLTKSKGLMYRYTVYTPQEEMKQILTADSEERLDTLRRVFGIDKYKRMQESAEIFLKLVRDKKKLMAVGVTDIEEKKREQAGMAEKGKDLEIQIHTLGEQLRGVREKMQEFGEQLRQLEEQKMRQQRLQQALHLKTDEVGHLEHVQARNAQEKSRLRLNIEKLLQEVREDIADYREQILGLQQEIQQRELEYRKLLAEFSAVLAEKNHLQKNVDKVNALDICPTCNQPVSSEHKQHLLGEEQQRLLQRSEQLRELESRKLEMEGQVGEQKEELASLQVLEKQQAVFRVKKEHLQTEQGALLRLQEEMASNQERILILQRELGGLQQQLAGVSLEGYDGLQQQHEHLGREERELYGRVLVTQRDVEHLQQEMERLGREIAEKELVQKRITKLNQLHQWMDEHFLEMVRMMERKVMVKVNLDFNGYFQKWFEMLVGGEQLKIAVGEDFSPRILQDGYDLEYSNLSGGEKTAVALAYRLALNQVINNIASEIKTRDVLILDEPTDGFSDEQLERMKNVLDELKIQQIILVSHEEKIESFVQHVIRLRKEGHVTRIV